MSDSKTSQGESDKKRNLPSWMGSKEHGKKSTSSRKNEESEEHIDSSQDTPSRVTIGSNESKGPGSISQSLSKLMEGVVFALSGFVNPERATLRSQALEMGAEYRPDWGPECTLLVCAYSNTPKFRQVEADGGTIVRKEWISECYIQKKLVEIDSYLMHAGKPWRKNNSTTENSSDQRTLPPRKSEKQVQRGSHSKTTIPSPSKSGASNPPKLHFAPSKVKEWAVDDLNRTISWLESQEEKPEPSEIKEIAAGGIIICLQDTIDSLEQDQDIRQIADQWNVVPRAVEELIKLVDAGNSSMTFANLCRQFKECKQMYEVELKNVNHNSKPKKRKLKADESDGKSNDISVDAAHYDSDETIEMTEEEIDLAYNDIASKISK